MRETTNYSQFSTFLFFEEYSAGSPSINIQWELPTGQESKNKKKGNTPFYLLVLLLADDVTPLLWEKTLCSACGGDHVTFASGVLSADLLTASATTIWQEDLPAMGEF